MNSYQLPTYFLSHGGGPWPYMKGDFREHFSKLETSLQDIARELGPRPKAVLMISGHWEENIFSVMSSSRPPMVYDYWGFPEDTYRVKYDALGSPELAHRVRELIETAGFESRLDPLRGFDHGAFVPLFVMYPQANVPVVQLSIRKDYDPQAHLKLGRVLAPLRQEGVLILGSGLSYHNLRRFDGRARKESHGFDEWLRATLQQSDPDVRAQRLTQWAQAPFARVAHPQEDHLIPLMVALGAAWEDPAEQIYHEEDFMGGLAVSSYRFGMLPK